MTRESPPHPPRPRIALAAVAALLLAACTNASLYHLTEVPALPNKVAFTGRVCTDNPAERRFPLRVVFVVDASPQLPSGLDAAQVSTLLQQRVSAVRDAVSVLRGVDTSFALIRFGGTSVMTPDGGFTSNTALMSEAAGALTVPLNCAPEGCRRTGQALQQAASLVTGDLLSTAKGPRSRTKYVVVLVQAGPVDDAILSGQTVAGCDEGCVLERRIDELRESVLASGGADFQFHALDVTPLSDDAAERIAAEDQLTRMAFAGGGEYLPVCRRRDDGTLAPPGCGAQSLSLLPVDIQSTRNVFIAKSFLVANLNARHTPEGAVPDSDADGIADEEEARLGTDPTRRDTDGDGIGDKVESLLSTVGVDPLAPDEPVQCGGIADPVLTDTDGDGLTDCEEMLLRMDPTLFDTDADGTPDLLELLYGTNFLEDDTLVDADFDGEPNAKEIKSHTDPRSADAKTRAELSYLYREVDLGIREIKFSTQPRDISGVTIDDVGADTSLGNALLVYLPGEVPALAFRDPLAGTVGPAVEIEGDGTYVLESYCAPDDSECQDLDRTLTVSVTRAILPPYPVDELVRIAVAERQCIDFRVRNVTLVETLEADGRALGANDIRIFFGQVPQSSPEAFGIFRVAQFPFRFVEPDYKEPEVADQPVESFRFVLFGD